MASWERESTVSSTCKSTVSKSTWFAAEASSRSYGRGTASCNILPREDLMLYTLAVILLIAWLFGLVGAYTIGAFVHLLLVVAIVLFVIGLLEGRTVV